MTWSGVDLLEYAPNNVTAGCVVDDRWVVTRQIGHAVLDLDTGQARAFDNTYGLVHVGGLVSLAGRAWTRSTSTSGIAQRLQSIDPASGSLADHHNTSSTVPMVAADTWVGATTWRYWPATDTLSTVNFGTVSSIGTLGDRAFTLSNVGITPPNYEEHDPVTGAVIATWPAGVGGFTNQSRAARIGNRLYWPAGANIPWLDPVAGTTGVVVPTPPGMPTAPATSIGWEAGPDGNLYRLVGNVNAARMVVIDPNTGRWADRAFLTARSPRYFLLSARGEIISPWAGAR